MTLRLTHVEMGHYWVEYALLALTLGLMARSLLRSEAGKPRDEAGMIGFKKVLAAHSFTWVGVQTMFVYMFAYVQDKQPAFTDEQVGSVLNLSFLVMCATVLVNLRVSILDRRGEAARGDRLDRRCRWAFPLTYFGLMAVMIGIALTFY